MYLTIFKAMLFRLPDHEINLKHFICNNPIFVVTVLCILTDFFICLCEDNWYHHMTISICLSMCMSFLLSVFSFPVLVTIYKESAMLYCSQMLNELLTNQRNINPSIASSVIKMSANGNISMFLALCEGNPLVTSGFPSQKASNMELWCFPWSAPEQMVEHASKQSIRRWFETPWCSLWCHCNGNAGPNWLHHCCAVRCPKSASLVAGTMLTTSYVFLEHFSWFL